MSKLCKSKRSYFIKCLCSVILSNLFPGLQKCKCCSALDFKDVGNKMAIDDSIICEKYGISVKSLIFCSTAL